MQKISDNVVYSVGSDEMVQNMRRLKVMPVFSENVIAFLHDIAGMLLRDKAAKAYPDVVTFGFWCRRSSIKTVAAPYADLHHCMGRGVLFHITPSNVAVNYAYSLAAGLLAGNANIVRLPSNDFEQVRIINRAIAAALENFQQMKPYICLLQYGRIKEVTDCFSAICDVRIIWGGNHTINEIRHSPLRPRSTEITFADRYSVCVIDADAYAKMGDKKKVAADFYNDTFLTDQKACTSPCLVVWMGCHIAEAQDRFWQEVYQIATEKYDMNPARAVAKLSAFYEFAAAHECELTCLSNLIYRIAVDRLDFDIVNYRLHSGYFFEAAIKKIEEMYPLCREECQTISYLGVDPVQIREFLDRHCPKGIDRVVPMGKTMDFSMTWDGHDLIRSLSRQIVFQL